MKLGGLQKLTLIDYPGRIAATVFTVGCSFRCPFCHNPELVLPSYGTTGSISREEVISFLKTRKNKLDGLCITGGEPTIQKDLLDFIKEVKELDFLVKLDSNGSRPDVLRKAFKDKLIDFVAMDIKNYPEKYAKTCGVDIDVERIKLSVDLIKNSGVEYEFRTTVAPGIHAYSDFDEIAKWLEGAKRYVLQKYYNEGKILSEEYAKKKYKKILDLERIQKKMEPYFEKVEVRR